MKIPLFTNVNIRAEFLDLHRRVMIPEGMCSLLADKGSSLPLPVQAKLKSISASAAKHRAEQKTYKPNAEAISEWRKLLIEHSHQADGWQRFCTDFLQGKIENIWDETCEALGINFLSLRDGDSSEWLTGQLTWDEMASIVGRLGIGSFDAMIINLFLNSKFAALITADREIVYVIECLKPDGKFVLVPDRLRI